MSTLKILYGLVPALGMSWANTLVADEPTEVNIDLLEFLGSMADDADEWEEFIEIVDVELPPVLAEVDHED